MTASDTIIALCTPRGAGALALLRISGVNALRVSNCIAELSSKKNIIECVTHTIEHGWVLSSTDNRIDEVLFFIMHGPKTFTGQDTVEITCHNNPFIIDTIMEAAFAAGARSAQPGEFAQWAVQAGKIDIVQAEAINEIIHANSQIGLRQSLAQLQGTLSAQVAIIEESIFAALAYSEASFEFVDDEIEFKEQLFGAIRRAREHVELLLQSYAQHNHIRSGVRIAIIGSVNAGKSSLFNTLTGGKRAIVADVAGTTRDVIEAGLYRHGLYWTIVDTAGLRTTDDQIEQEGIRRSYEQAACADLIILAYDGSQEKTSPAENAIYTDLVQQYPHKIIPVLTKADVLQAQNTMHGLVISIHTGMGIAKLWDTLDNAVENLFSKTTSPFLLNERHYHLLSAAHKNLTKIEECYYKQPHYELISYHLKEVLAQCGQLTGKTISEAGMDLIFRQFCVGK